MSYQTVPRHTAPKLYRIIPWTVPNHTIPNRAVPNRTIQNGIIALKRSVPFTKVPFCAISYDTIPPRTAYNTGRTIPRTTGNIMYRYQPYNSVPYNEIRPCRNTSYRTTKRGDIVLRRTTSFETALEHVIPTNTVYSNVRCHIVYYGIVIHHAMPYRTVPHHPDTLLYHAVPYHTLPHKCHTVPRPPLLPHRATPYHATQRCNVRHHTHTATYHAVQYHTTPRRATSQRTVSLMVTGRRRGGGGYVNLANPGAPMVSPGYQQSGHLVPRGIKLADQRRPSRPMNEGWFYLPPLHKKRRTGPSDRFSS